LIKRVELVKYLDKLLEIQLWEEVDSSLNGLQVEGADQISSIALAVDGCEQTFEMSRDTGAQMLIVHHGLFWGDQLPLTGAHRRRVKLLLEAGISLYAAHLPLDFNPLIGHNACIARDLGLQVEGPLKQEKSLPVGTLARAEPPLAREKLAAKVESLLATKATLLPFGKEKVENIGIVSGSGSKLVDEALCGTIDTFLTGEASHTLYHQAKEFGLNVIFAGHYATEFPGLKALAKHLSERFGLETSLLESPTGL
jgi:dinuclear metal center YbgI/SA1388 family protein